MKDSVQQYVQQMEQLLAEFPVEEAVALIDRIAEAYQEDRSILVMGNGGSASTASHFAADLNKNVIPKGRRPRVIALTDNVEAITAWGNDSAYEDVFVEQLKNFFRKGDTVVAISGSGRSPNIIKAAEWTKQNEGELLALTGPRGEPLRHLADASLTAPTDSMEQIEDYHLIWMHMMIVAMRKHFTR